MKLEVASINGLRFRDSCPAREGARPGGVAHRLEPTPRLIVMQRVVSYDGLFQKRERAREVSAPVFEFAFSHAARDFKHDARRIVPNVCGFRNFGGGGLERARTPSPPHRRGPRTRTRRFARNARTKSFPLNPREEAARPGFPSTFPKRTITWKRRRDEPAPRKSGISRTVLRAATRDSIRAPLSAAFSLLARRTSRRTRGNDSYGARYTE